MAYTEQELAETQAKQALKRSALARTSRGKPFVSGKPAKRKAKPAKKKQTPVKAKPATQSIVIDIRFPSLNDYTKANRGNKYGGNKIKQEFTDAVQWACKEQKVKPVVNPCKIFFKWYDDGRRDPDNIAFAKKFILDGMVKAGVLKNDTWRYIRGFTDDFVKCKKVDARVEIMIKEEL